MPAERSNGSNSARRGIAYLDAVLKLLEDRIPHLRGRSGRLLRGCALFAKLMRLSPPNERALLLAARFKDVGLVGVSDELLLRPSVLSLEERDHILRQRVQGANLFALVFPQYPDAVECMWYHVEQPDGRGPHGLRLEEIPLPAAILGFVDAVESMANTRPQRPPLPTEVILQEVDRQNGLQFHPDVVSAFRQRSPEILQLLRAGHPPATPDPTEVHDRAPPPPPLPPPPPAQKQGAPATVGASAQPGGLKSLRDLSPVITKADLQRLVTKGLELRPLASAMENLLATTANPQCSVDDVAQVIMQDQSIAVRVLKLANSSAYSRGRPLNGVKEAVGRIGIQEIRQLTLGLSVLEQYEGAIAGHLEPHWFWEHSLACGATCSQIATACGMPGADHAFLWGIVHDVGRLVLADSVPDQYAKVWEAADALDAPLELVEARLMLLDHCDVVKRALEYWKFSRELTIVVANHHQTLANLKRLGPEQCRAAATVALADALCHAHFLGSSGNDTIYPVEDLVQAVGIDPAHLGTIMEAVSNEVSALKCSLLAHSHGGKWPERVDVVRARLRTTPVPLSLSTQPETDAFRMCFRRLCGDTSAAPNLAVMYAPDSRELEALFRRLAVYEAENSLKPLPLMAIWTRGDQHFQHKMLDGRSHRLLRAPVREKRLVLTIHELLPSQPAGSSPPAPAAAAATMPSAA
jgi:HD-like signal output (HDOD) protein